MDFEKMQLFGTEDLSGQNKTFLFQVGLKDFSFFDGLCRIGSLDLSVPNEDKVNTIGIHGGPWLQGFWFKIQVFCGIILLLVLLLPILLLNSVLAL